MIQRKQTIFLILALFSFVFLFVFPFASFELGELTYNFNILGVQNSYGIKDCFTKLNYMFVIMQVLATLFISLTGIAIFRYKKRPLQIRLCAFAFLVNILMIGAMFLTGSMVVGEVSKAAIPISYLLPAYIPIVKVLLITMAQRAIRKDEAMVQSLNRLR
jgi:hypothetical protein